MHPSVDPELVMATADVLYERVTADDYAGGPIVFEAAHRPQPRCAPTMVGFDPVVRVLLGVVEPPGINSSTTARSVQARSVTTSAGAP
jgi:hypothetical protein